MALICFFLIISEFEHLFICLFVTFFFSVLGFELRALHLLGSHSTTGATLPALV
jgi:hypothetical protein